MGVCNGVSYDLREWFELAPCKLGLQLGHISHLRHLQVCTVVAAVQDNLLTPLHAS